MDYQQNLTAYIGNRSLSNGMEGFLIKKPEFINSKLIIASLRKLFIPIVFIAICQHDDKLLRFLLEKFSPYLGKRKLPLSIELFNNEIVSSLDAAVCVEFYAGIEWLLAYGSLTDLAPNISSGANEKILSLVDSHSYCRRQQITRNRLKDGPYFPFWEAPSSSATTLSLFSELESD